MSDALLADLRAHADDLRRDMEELPGHPQWNQWYIEESHLRRLIAKHTPEPDACAECGMSDDDCCTQCAHDLGNCCEACRATAGCTHCATPEPEWRRR